jgi:hypothetical protein
MQRARHVRGRPVYGRRRHVLPRSEHLGSRAGTSGHIRTPPQAEPGFARPDAPPSGRPSRQEAWHGEERQLSACGIRSSTGYALPARRGEAQPPQSMLLVVPHVRTGSWRADDLVAAVAEAFDLARARLVEPAQLDGTGYAHLLSATRRPTTVTLRKVFRRPRHAEFSGLCSRRRKCLMAKRRSSREGSRLAVAIAGFLSGQQSSLASGRRKRFLSSGDICSLSWPA